MKRKIPPSSASRSAAAAIRNPALPALIAGTGLRLAEIAKPRLQLDDVRQADDDGRRRPGLQAPCPALAALGGVGRGSRRRRRTARRAAASPSETFTGGRRKGAKPRNRFIPGNPRKTAETPKGR